MLRSKLLAARPARQVEQLITVKNPLRPVRQSKEQIEIRRPARGRAQSVGRKNSWRLRQRPRRQPIKFQCGDQPVVAGWRPRSGNGAARPDARQQLAANWPTFLQIVVGTHFEADDAIDFSHIAVSIDDRAKVGRGCADAGTAPKPFSAGSMESSHDQSMRRPRTCSCSLRSWQTDMAIALPCQKFGQQRAEFPVRRRR